ncbi:unnamed protein product [Oncorhynchus mykiss]|uniref:Solute carrier family 43 member 3a n=1 Tax=Oncorhynchus mykiss TaxID=8022 RepID=A0A060W1X0_ONCMY|nr:unnamed protein product [Oncorhynchus mykiss]
MLGCEGEAVVRRWLTLVTGLLECLCFAGAVFGWASLVFVLKTEGYFSYLCVNTTGVNGTQFLGLGTLMHTHLPILTALCLYCSAQDEQFSLVFTIASFMNNFLLLPNGFLFDRFGTMVARLLGMVDNLYSTISIIDLQKAQCYEAARQLAIRPLGGVFYNQYITAKGCSYARRNGHLSLYHSLQQFHSVPAHLSLCLWYLSDGGKHEDVYPLVLSHYFSGCHILLFPFGGLPIPQHTPCGSSLSVLCVTLTRVAITSCDRINCGQTKTFSPEQTAAIASVQSEDVTEETPFNKESAEKVATFWECFLSKFFLWHLVWLSVMQLRHYLFIGTLNPMLQRLTQGEPSLVSTYTNAFAVTQLCGVLCAPWNGLIMDRHKGKPRAPGTIFTYRH